MVDTFGSYFRFYQKCINFFVAYYHTVYIANFETSMVKVSMCL